MKLTSFLAFLIASVCVYSVKASAAMCDWHMACQPNLDCTCTVSKGGWTNRFFWIDFSKFKRGTNYTCQFTTSPYHVANHVGVQTISVGSKVTCTSQDCENFPMTFYIDTKKMKDKEGKATVIYSVDPNNPQADVTAKCTPS